jgi:methylated-DNA-[protein]-cysteine S-methyltransferase
VVPDAVETVPPPEVRDLVERIVALTGGEPVDLSDVALDARRVPAFDLRVYEITRTIPPGSTMSYGAVADRLGSREAARDVGRALARNPWPMVVPCHRVVGSGGWAGGFSAEGGVATKLRLLRIEGAAAGGDPTLFD